MTTTHKPNPSFATNPAYSFLFEKITPDEEAIVMRRPLLYSALWWAAALGHYSNLYGVWTMGFIMVFSVLQVGIANHDCLHAPNAHKLPLLRRVLLFAATPMGFTPVSPTFGDFHYFHNKEHHLETKSVLDATDPDSWWSQIPLPLMLVLIHISPSDVSAYELLGMYSRGEQHMRMWLERILATLFMYAQLALLHQMGILFPALLASHLANAQTYTLFHGLLHRPSWYRMLVSVDPSGGRRIPYVDPVLCALLGEEVWAEILFHDIHHSHSLQVGCTHLQYVTGRASPKRIRAAIEGMADEGAMVDAATGTAVSPLESVGHQLGARAAYLAKRHDEPSAAPTKLVRNKWQDAVVRCRRANLVGRPLCGGYGRGA